MAVSATTSASIVTTTVLSHYSGELTSRLQEAVAKARQEAAVHRPPSDAAFMDANEADLQSEAQRAIASEHQIFTGVMTESSRFAHQLQQKVPDLEARIQQSLTDTSLQSEAAAEMAEERASLVAATQRRMLAEVELRSFRAKHGVTEQAVYPESHIWHFAIIIGLALLETMVNAVFYENAQGLLGGFVVALSVAVINMAGALVLGMLFRFKNLSDPEKKVAGWACLAVFVALSVYCNALFASFRASYQLLADPSDAMQVRHAFRGAVAQAGRVFLFRMEFGDLMSFVLFGVGLLLSLLAFYKGYSFDDRVPGHGAKDRTVKAAQAVESARQEKVRQRLKDFLQRRRRELQAVSREPTDLMSEAGARAAAFQHAYTVCQANQGAIQRDFALLLNAYRNANAAIRATEPPEYFKTISDVQIAVNQNEVNGVLAIISNANERAKVLRDKYQDRLNTKLNEIQRDAAELLDKAFEEYLRSVERDAQEVINRMTITVQRAGIGIQPNDVH